MTISQHLQYFANLAHVGLAIFIARCELQKRQWLAEQEKLARSWREARARSLAITCSRKHPGNQELARQPWRLSDMGLHGGYHKRRPLLGMLCFLTIALATTRGLVVAIKLLCY